MCWKDSLEICGAHNDHQSKSRNIEEDDRRGPLGWKEPMEWVEPWELRPSRRDSLSVHTRGVEVAVPESLDDCRLILSFNVANTTTPSTRQLPFLGEEPFQQPLDSLAPAISPSFGVMQASLNAGPTRSRNLNDVQSPVSIEQSLPCLVQPPTQGLCRRRSTPSQTSTPQHIDSMPNVA
ncbi:hypothetical protein NMY22_g3844 [Coprinellus aureogranulatus]|nr:hypothetical protein NMY22_g3844 [Coprinellus aureogranulatus]